MVKILLTSWGKGTGGADNVVRTNAEELRRRGIETDVLDHHYNPPFILDTPKGTVHFQTVDQLVGGIDWANYGVLHNAACTLSETEINGIRRENPELPHLYTAHSMLIHEAINHPDYRQFKADFDASTEREKRRIIGQFKRDKYVQSQTRTFEQADRVLHMTRHGLQVFDLYYPEHSDKALALPHGTDLTRYDTREADVRARRIRQELHDGKIIFYAGRILKEKGILDLVDAFERLKTTHPDARLLILGGGRNGSERLVYQRVGSEHRRDVVMHPWTDDNQEKVAHYKAADIVVVPSYNETFCMTALEAMTVGTPVAISDVDGPAEVWVKPMLAYGTRPGDVGSIADRVDFVFSNPSQARENARRVQEVARTRHNIRTVMNAYLALYDHEVEKKGNGHLIRPNEREEFYATLAELSGDERFRKAGQTTRKQWNGTTLTPEDKMANGVFAGAVRENINSNGTGQSVRFYTTPGFKHIGIVVKRVTPEEARVLRDAPTWMTGKYRIPEVLALDRLGLLVAQQRVYGPDMLNVILRSPETAVPRMTDAAEWLKQFHGHARQDNYDLGSTQAYKKFIEKLVADTNRFGRNEDFVRIGQLLEEKWKYKRPKSAVGLVHGDMSPIHLFYEDGYVYGIDFNASHEGPTNEDPGMFIGNASYHLVTAGKPQAYINNAMGGFLDAYGVPIEIGFYLASSYYNKARDEREKTPNGFLSASRRLLERPFDISLIGVPKV